MGFIFRMEHAHPPTTVDIIPTHIWMPDPLPGELRCKILL